MQGADRKEAGSGPNASMPFGLLKAPTKSARISKEVFTGYSPLAPPFLTSPPLLETASYGPFCTAYATS